MSANQTTFKSLGVDKNEAIEQMAEWLLENDNRGIMVSPSEGIALAFSPTDEEINQPDMYWVSFAYCNVDENKFRRNVGAWLAYTRGVDYMETALMRRDILNLIIESFDLESW